MRCGKVLQAISMRLACEAHVFVFRKCSAAAFEHFEAISSMQTYVLCAKSDISPVARALFCERITSKLIDETSRLPRTSVAYNLVAILDQGAIFVEGGTIVELTHSASIRCRARKRVGSIQLWIEICPASCSQGKCS